MTNERERSPVEYLLSRWLFLRLLGVVCLIAFVSLWTQIHGLVGSSGILPAANYLEAVKSQIGSECYWRLPTLCWLNCSDTTLSALCGLGTALSLLLIIGFAPRAVSFCIWFVYLSLCSIGQDFLSFQWDVLLLETCFFAMFYAPATLLPRLSREQPPSTIARWAMWLLLFKLMFLSGVTKLLSGDPTWRDLTAMNYHYETQPIPSWISWYVHHSPTWFHKSSVVIMFIGELAVPFCIFMPRLFRHIGCAAMILLQVSIQLTGNFGFFNLLTIALCVPLLDDRLLRWPLPNRWTAWLDAERPRPKSHVVIRSFRIAAYATIGLLLFISGLTFIREMVRSHDKDKLPAPVVVIVDTADTVLLSWGEPYILRWTNAFRTINGYGLFRVMTAERPEIVIEGSHDGITWKQYEFKWKPGDVTRPPGIVAPHMPRLDWQMWFAALGPGGARHWLIMLAQRLLEGEPEVLALLADNPFSDDPPRYIRLVQYQYVFSNPATKRATGNWWRRTRLRDLTAPLSLPHEQR